MKITGTIISVLPVESGVGKTSGKQWKKGGFIIEQGGQYPKKACVTLFGKALDEFTARQGDSVEADVDVESREYNGRWYTEVKAFRVAVVSPNPPAPASPTPTLDAMGVTGNVQQDFGVTPPDGNDVEGDDLPF